MNDVTDSGLTSRIAELFPARVAVSACATLPANARLLPAEEPDTAAMVPHRLREYTLGRHCARTALRNIGHAAVAVPRNADRSPAWPAGIIGSISHSGDIAAAVVGHATDFAGLGLDIESPEPLSTDLAAMICRDDEGRSGDNAKLLFGIKEAIYKCIYPTVGIYVDFKEMAVELNLAGSSFTAQPHSPNFEPATIAGLQGRFVKDEDYLICAAWLPGRQD
jgi:4'-phosphopantetheinyl transferase EntD